MAILGVILGCILPDQVYMSAEEGIVKSILTPQSADVNKVAFDNGNIIAFDDGNEISW